MFMNTEIIEMIGFVGLGRPTKLKAVAILVLCHVKELRQDA